VPAYRIYELHARPALVVAFGLTRSDNLAVVTRQQLRNCDAECIEALKGDWPGGTRAPRQV
jgi:hypothetical protein